MNYQKYSILAGMINTRGIKRSAIAKRLGISPKTLSGKIRGNTGFVFEEAQTIQSEFFPDIPLEQLFSIDNSLTGSKEIA